jgi:alpha-beta hydrolase superfamily lysophospholipase
MALSLELLRGTMERFEVATGDRASPTGFRWLSQGPPKAIVQLAHGAAEHLGRYDRLADRLTQAGYAVFGADHRGHGVNRGLHGLGNLGPRGFAGVVDDMRAVAEAARAQFPDAPLVLLGHSFGSFAAQLFLAKHAELIDGLVLSGTAAIELLLAGADMSSGLAAANAAFEPARTPFDWLSRDEAEVDAYIADPLCGFDLKLESMATMPEAVAALQGHDGLAVAARRGLPVYIVSGELDPIVGPGQVLSRALEETYRKAGIRDVTHRIYPGGRHEMFNEINRDEVERDLLAWLDARYA